MRALLLFLALASAALSQDYRPPAYVLYGHGRGGDGLGIGFRDAYLSTPSWGRYDNSVPGYRSHGMKFSNPYYGHTSLDSRVHYVGASPQRGRHNATLTYDRHGHPTYITCE